jgi:hypothetical protein
MSHRGFQAGGTVGWRDTKRSARHRLAKPTWSCQPL